MRLAVVRAASRSLHVRLRLPQTGCRGWHLALADGLRARSHRVSVDLVAAAAPSIPGMALLRFVESTLYSARTANGPDNSAAIPPQRLAQLTCADPVDVVMDCTGLTPSAGTCDLFPDLEGQPDEAGLVAALIAEKPPVVGWRRGSDGALVSTGPAAITARHILSQGLSQSLALLVSQGIRAVSDIADGHPGSPVAGAPPSRLPRSAGVGGFVLSNLADRILHRTRRHLIEPRQWNIAWRASRNGEGIVETGRLSLEGFHWLKRDPTRYFADPFPVVHEGQIYLFCEEFPYATGRGLLSVMTIAADGTTGPVQPVLDVPHHLSYPCIFERDGQLWMIPETAAARTLELYRAERFPDRWVRHAILADNVDFADSTFFEHDGLCWIAATTSEHGASDRDSLSLFYAEALDGPWQAHPRNPVVVDVRSSRPAGWIERCADGLRRPAQDCSGGYGWGLAINRIERLSRNEYAETTLARIPPPVSLSATGLHTVNRAGGIEVIDAIVP